MKLLKDQMVREHLTRGVDAGWSHRHSSLCNSFQHGARLENKGREGDPTEVCAWP